MKVNMKKLFAMILVLTMIIGMIPAVSAEGDVTEVSTSADFVTAMANGGNIKLTGSFTLSAKATVPAGKTVVLDLSDYQIISDNGNSKYIENLGTLTIKASGENGGITTGAGTSGQSTRAIRNTGTLAIEGGSFVSESIGNTYTVFSAGGSVAITGGSFSAKYTGTSKYHAAAIAASNDAELSISGNAQLTAESGSNHDSSLVASMLATDGEVTANVTGGSFNGNRSAGAQVASAVSRVGTATMSVAISGGNFKVEGNTKAMFAEGVTPTITGGTFSEDVSSYLGNGYVQNPDGSVSGSSQQPEATEVATSADFVAAMEKGGNIRLTGSVTLEAKATVPAGVTVTLDLNGHKITSNDGYNYNVNNAGTLTIIDSGVTGEISVVSADDVEQNIICINNTGSLTVEDGKFTAVSKKRTAYALYSESRDLTINGGEFVASLDKSASYSAHALALAGDASVEDSVATINGGIFTATSISTSSSARCAPLFARSANKIHITINGGTFTGTRTDATRGASAWRYGDSSQNVTLTIKGGTFSAENSGDNGFVSAQKGTLNISGGTFRYDGTMFTEKPTSITGGTFVKVDGSKNDISDKLDEGYIQGSNGAVTLFQESEAGSFDAFCAALAKDGKVTLTDSFELTGKAEIPAGKTVILDLNGKTITSNNGITCHISNAGKLTIVDSGENGTISVKSNKSNDNVICINNDGELIIEDGTFVTTSQYRTGYVLFSKGKSVVINGGTFASYYDCTGYNKSYQAQTLGFGGENAGVTINGGTFIAESNSPKTDTRCATLYMMASGNPTVTVNGGNFTSTRTVGVNGATIMRNQSGENAKLIINGGTFNASAGADCMMDATAGQIEINGGTFTYDAKIFTEERGTITGGKFVKSNGELNDITARVAKNYVQLETGEVVSATNLPDVIKVGTTTYKTVWEAIDKSTSGKTVTLLTDAKTELAVSLAEGVILDLNGHALETPAVFSDAGQIIDSAQTGLLKIPKGYATFNSMNSHLPVYDASAGGYRMANTKIQVKAVGEGMFYFRFDLTNADWEALLPANDISLLVCVDGYAQRYKAEQMWLDALYADATGRGAISVTFTNAPDDLDIQVIIANGRVEVNKGTKSTALAPVGPSSTVDPLAADVREYLAKASTLYDGATIEQLLEMKSPKLAGQSLNDSKQPITLSWRWDASIPADSQFTIELSQTEDFAEVQTLACTHFNANVSVQSEPFWNPLMGTTYYWRVAAKLTDGSTVTGKTMSFTTEEGLRMIRLSGGWNTRDLGGWETSEIKLFDGTVLPAGKTTQGLVYRSARLQSLTAEGQATVLNELGIKTEIDLRDPKSVSDRATTCFKNGELTYITGPSTAKAYGAFITEPEVAYTYLIEFTKAENYPILFHCAIGADRTGSLAFILNALQGVAIEDLVKDYEITTDRFVQGLGTSTDFPALMEEFNKLEGATTYEKARTFCLSTGLTDQEIDCIIQYMRGNLDYKP